MFPNDDLTIQQLFSGHDDLLEDVRRDFSVRLGEAEQPQSEFFHPDTNPTLQPLMTNASERWKKIRPSVLASLSKIHSSVCGDEAATILQKFNFRCMEATHSRGGTSNPGRKTFRQNESFLTDAQPFQRSPVGLSSTLKERRLRVDGPLERSSRNDGSGTGKRLQESRMSTHVSTPLDLLSQADALLSESDSMDERSGNPRRPRGGPTFAQEFGEMNDEKPGTVCSECGRTVTNNEYSSGQPNCCEKGSVIPEEQFGQNFDEDCGNTKRHKDGRKYDNKEDVVEAMIDQFASTGVLVVEASKSCWGCGDDWKARWSSNDLAKMKPSSKFGSANLCPDCIEEAQPTDSDFAATPNRRTSIGPKASKGPGVPVYKLAGSHHACGNCGWTGQKTDATHCPNCKYGKLRTVDHTGKEVSESREPNPEDVLRRNGFKLDDSMSNEEEQWYDHPTHGRVILDQDGGVHHTPAGRKERQYREFSDFSSDVLKESVAPGYLPKPNASNNSLRPNGLHTADTPPSASEALQDLHRRLGSALPELHGLAVSTITDERAALGMLFNELHTAHCDLGNVLSYHNQIPDQEMSALVSHYSRVVSEMLGALNPYMLKNPAVSTGPYHVGGQLHDNEALTFAQSRLGNFNSVSEMLVKYREFVNTATPASGKDDIKRLQEACSKLVEDQSWYQPKKLGVGDTDWSYGKGSPIAQGQNVKVNLPGHVMHGSTGRIMRQQGTQFAVEFPHKLGKVEFFNSAQLEKQ